MPAKNKTNKTIKPAMAKKTVAQKTVAAKTAATSSKSAPAKVAESGCKCAKRDVSSSKLTRVIVKYNVGWGNQLFIRGTGAGLNWHKGVLMQCVGEDEWLWEQLVSQGGLKFKVLVNDEIWNIDEDSSVEAGDTVIFHPKF